MNKYLIAIILFLCAFLLPLSVFAKSINLYESPKDGAKVVSTLDSDTGIIPIFTPEKGDWMKVADPRNGNVGWVKVKDLGSANNTEYSFTQRFINTGTSPLSYQIIQFGGPNKISSDQVQQMMKQNEVKQQQIQDNINKAMQNMVNQMNSLYHWNAGGINSGVPFVMPVIVIPAQNLQGAESSDKGGKKGSGD